MTEIVGLHPFAGAQPYPWERPEAMALYDVLRRDVTLASEIVMLVQMAAPRAPALNLAQPPAELWRDALAAVSVADGLLPLCERLATDGRVRVARAARAVLEAKPAVRPRQALLDELRYPWHEPLAQQLHQTLVDLYPANQAAVLLAGEVGLDTSTIVHQQPVMFVWKDILDAAAPGKCLPALVGKALDRLSPNHPSWPFLEELLAGGTPAVSAEPRRQDGAPSFLHDDDEVSVPEAMLFGDDLTLPVGQVPGLITALGKALVVSPSVCKLSVGFAFGEQYGTAFRIGPGLLLTNWHVVHRRGDGAPAVTVSAEFGFENDAAGGPLAPRIVRCEAGPAVSDPADDWAVVRAAEPLDEAWPVLSLADVAVPVVHDPAYIVQHPMGQRKRVGFVRNQISYVDDRVVHYMTDTDIGSSGSPVLDAAGRLIALHHRGGRPQEAVGGSPVRKNEGIRMSRIAAALADRGIGT